MGKAIIAIAVAAVVVIAGAGVAFYMMNKDNDDPKSDYSLLDSGKEIKANLVYIDEKDMDGFYQKLTITTSTDSTPTDIYAVKELYTKYSDFKEDIVDYDASALISNFFDFTKDGTAPEGVTVTKTMDGLNAKYEITGEGDILGEEGSKKTVKFEDGFYVKITPLLMILEASGKATVDGKYIYNHDTFDYTKLSIEFKDGKAVTDGKYDAQLNTNFYPSSEVFINSVFVKFNPSVYGDKITTKDVSYKGVDCKEHTLKATIFGQTYDVVFHSINGFMIDGDGTVNGKDMSETIQIYYL